MNAFLGQTGTVRVEIGLPFMKQLRLSPGLYEALNDVKPASMSWGDFVRLGMVTLAHMMLNISGQPHEANRLNVRIFGAAQTVVGEADDRQERGRS